MQKATLTGSGATMKLHGSPIRLKNIARPGCSTPGIGFGGRTRMGISKCLGAARPLPLKHDGTSLTTPAQPFQTASATKLPSKLSGRRVRRVALETFAANRNGLCAALGRLLKRLANSAQQSLFADGFAKKLDCARSESGTFIFFGSVGAQEDNRNAVAILSETALQFQAVHRITWSSMSSPRSLMLVAFS